MRLPLLAAIAALASCTASSGGRSPREAEFAIRWDPAEGGPRTERDVVRLLGLSDVKESAFEVRYFDAPAPANAPDSARVILRERAREGGVSELVVKYRRTEPVADEWACPLATEAKRSSQVDVGFGPDSVETRVYSYTCELPGDSFPPSLHAAPRACTISVTRAAGGGYKIETWSLAGGGTLLEVSHVGRDTHKDLQRFRRTVNVLTAAGVRPTMRSKTELAGGCSS